MVREWFPKEGIEMGPIDIRVSVEQGFNEEFSIFFIKWTHRLRYT